MATRRIDHDVLESIEDLALRGSTPAQITRELGRRPTMRGRVPTQRTVQRIVRDLAAEDDSAPWRLAPAEPDQEAVMRIRGASIADGWRIPITVREAAWITAIRRAVPDIGPITTRLMARLYLAREARGDPTDVLDSILAIAPWRNPESRALYEALVAAGELPRLPILAGRQAGR